MKKDLDLQDFIQHCKKVAQHNAKRKITRPENVSLCSIIRYDKKVKFSNIDKVNRKKFLQFIRSKRAIERHTDENIKMRCKKLVKRKKQFINIRL